MGTRVYCGRLNYRVSERDIEHFFRGYGKILEVILKNGFAFVEFADYRDADDAVHDLNGRELCGDRVHVDLARGTPHGRDRYRYPMATGGGRERERERDRDRDRYRGGRSPPPPRREPRRDRDKKAERTDYRLVIENLSSRVSWQDLKDYFRQVGEVTYTDAHGKRKNEGLVEFAHKSDMKKALDSLDGKELSGRKLRLTEERKRAKSGSPERRSPSGSPRSGSSRSRSPGSPAADGAEEKRGGKSSPAPGGAAADSDEEEGGGGGGGGRKRTRSSPAEDGGSERDAAFPDQKRNRNDSEQNGNNEEDGN